MNKAAGNGILPRSLIYKKYWSQFYVFCYFIWGMMKRVFIYIYNYKTSDFNVIYHSVVWNFENVLSRVIWASQDLQVDRSWVTVYRSGIFFLYIPCHSRHRVYLQCHCQLKLKTGGRCNDIERRASIISFSSMTHTDNQFLLWGLPKNNKSM